VKTPLGRAAIAAAFAVAVLAMAPSARADEPPVRYPPSSVRWKLVAGGGGIFAGAYGIGAAFSAAFPEVPGSEAMYIPVAGPWIALGQSGCATDDPGCEAMPIVRGVLYVLDGFIQAGGLAIAGEGIFGTTESAAPRTTGQITITPVPVVTPERAGLGVVGSF
jgi:hypothetical protein